MENEDPIVALTQKLDTLIARTVTIESIDKKLIELKNMIDETHKLVNSRMTELTAALEKAAALASMLAGEEGEERGAAQERARAKQAGEPDG